VSARLIREFERVEQSRDPGRQIVECGRLPELERDTKVPELAAVELDRPAGAHGLEPSNDLVAARDDAEALDEVLALVPSNLDDRASDGDVYTVEPARFHLGRAYNGAAS
jgi:hypothetical protein